MVAPRTTPTALVELQGERPGPGSGPDRAAESRPVRDGEDTRDLHYRIIPPYVPIIAPECLVVIHTTQPGLLGKRFPLEREVTRIGRVADNDIVLESDEVSRWHARIVKRDQTFLLADLDSLHGTCCNHAPISRETVLQDGDRVTIGTTLFRFLAGDGVEERYHDEMYRLTITDGLTQIHNLRFLYESLDRAMIRARRDEQELSILLFDVNHLERVTDAHGSRASDFVRWELARLVEQLCRPDDVFTCHRGEEFALLLPRTSLVEAEALATALHRKVSAHVFTEETTPIAITVRTGTADLQDTDRIPADLVKRAAAARDRDMR